MTVAITGASGHIGANLIRALLDEGRAVRVLVHHNAAALEGLDVVRVKGDVLDAASLRALLDGVDTVYHAAAIITLRARRDPAAWRVNVEGPRNVAEACLACGVRRLLHFSSIHAFSAYPRDAVVDESRPRLRAPEGMIYDRSKAEGERAILEYVERGLDAVILNPTGVLGPLDYQPSHMGRFLLDLRKERLPALVNGGFNWVDVRDVCSGAVAAERLGRRGERYLLAGHYLTSREIAQAVEQVTGARAPAFTAPIRLAQCGLPFAAVYNLFRKAPAGFTRASLYALRNYRHISHAKAARELGYAPRPIRETIEDTLEWFENAGYR